VRIWSGNSFREARFHPSIDPSYSHPPQEEVEEIIPTLQQVDEVMRPQPNENGEIWIKGKEFLNLSQIQLHHHEYWILSNVHIDKVISEYADEKHVEEFTFLLESLVVAIRKKKKKP